MDGRALRMAYLVDDVDVAAMRRHYELAGGGVHLSLHARSDHLEMVKAASMAYLIDAGDGVDSGCLGGIRAGGRRIGDDTLSKVAIRAGCHALRRVFKHARRGLMQRGEVPLRLLLASPFYRIAVTTVEQVISLHVRAALFIAFKSLGH